MPKFETELLQYLKGCIIFPKQTESPTVSSHWLCSIWFLCQQLFYTSHIIKAYAF